MSLWADEGSSALFFSILFRHFFFFKKTKFSHEEGVSEGKICQGCVPCDYLQDSLEDKNCEGKGKRKEKPCQVRSGNLLLHLKSEKGPCVGSWALSLLGKSQRPSDCSTCSDHPAQSQDLTPLDYSEIRRGTQPRRR